MAFPDMVKLHPQPSSLDRDALLRCVEECRECAASCTACADASLAESDLPHLIRVIPLCLDCADVCDATSRAAIRRRHLICVPCARSSRPAPRSVRTVRMNASATRAITSIAAGAPRPAVGVSGPVTTCST